jgi:hypothetical protein
MITSYSKLSFMTYLIELLSRSLFDGNKGLAYRQMVESGYWGNFLRHYDVSHSQSSEMILDDARQWFAKAQQDTQQSVPKETWR